LATEVSWCGLGCIFKEFAEVASLPESKATRNVFNGPVGFKQEDFCFFDFFIVDIGYKVHIHFFFEKFAEVVVTQINVVSGFFKCDRPI
jgi:hypothetical protein